MANLSTDLWLVQFDSKTKAFTVDGFIVPLLGTDLWSIAFPDIETFTVDGIIFATQQISFTVDGMIAPIQFSGAARPSGRGIYREDKVNKPIADKVPQIYNPEDSTRLVRGKNETLDLWES